MSESIKSGQIRRQFACLGGAVSEKRRHRSCRGESAVRCAERAGQALSRGREGHRYAAGLPSAGVGGAGLFRAAGRRPRSGTSSRSAAGWDWPCRWTRRSPPLREPAPRLLAGLRGQPRRVPQRHPAGLLSRLCVHRRRRGRVLRRKRRVRRRPHQPRDGRAARAGAERGHPRLYGALPDGSVKTSRGGSDVTGAIVARAVMADPGRELDRRVGLPDGRPAHRPRTAADQAHHLPRAARAVV